MGEEAADVCPHAGRVAQLSAQLALPRADLLHSGHPEVCLSVYLSVCLSVLVSVSLSVCLSIYLSVSVSDCPFDSLSNFCLPVCLIEYLSLCLFILKKKRI